MTGFVTASPQVDIAEIAAINLSPTEHFSNTIFNTSSSDKFSSDKTVVEERINTYKYL